VIRHNPDRVAAMNRPNRYKVNSPAVIHEMIDGEIILVNLEKGHYYSLLNSGAEILEYIIRGMSQPEIASVLSAQYQEDPKVIEKAVEDLVLELQAEEILIHDESQEAGDHNFENLLASKGNKKDEGFRSPILETYTDMEDLLLLDPIHEVDESGWPNMAPITPEEGK